MGLLGKQQQEHIIQNKTCCLITGRSKSSPDTQTGEKSTWSSCSSVATYVGSFMETKSFSLWLYIPTTNKYKEPEEAWIQKVFVPYQIIHLSLLLWAAFCCCFSLCFISTREWAQVGRKQMSPVSPPSVPLESQGCLPKWRRKKQGASSCICRFAVWTYAIS